MEQYYPLCWRTMVRAFDILAEDLGKNQFQDQKTLVFLKHEIGRLQKSLEQVKSRTIQVPREFPQELARSANEAIKTIRDQQLKLAKKLEQIVDDFATAEENEDRFVLLVFGEVNAGKSGLANHMAGCDFDLPEELKLRRHMFVGSASVERLGEKAVECTSEYQGFRLPGLHWIDCPGVLSTTMKNSELAKRLLGRADFILFVSSSDAPLKESEMKELAVLVEESGVDKVDASLLVSKADDVIEDEDWETESIVRRLVKKDADKIDDQIAWCDEQLKVSGVASYLQVIEPLPVSVYIARDRMGRDWVTGGFRSEPQSGWENAYNESGIDELCKLLTEIASKQGAAIKENWPRKKEAALRRLLSHTSKEALIALEKLDREVDAQRQTFSAVQGKVSHDAAILAAGQVKNLLVRHGVYDLDRFDRQKAAVELKEVICKTVTAGIEIHLRQILTELFDKIDTAMNDFAKRIDIAFELQERTRAKTYKSKVKGETVGGMAGGVGGTWFGGVIGSALGPIGTVVGSAIGGAIGGYTGKKAGGCIYEEDVTVVEKLGTNADEVIIMTEKRVQKLVATAVKQAFAQLDGHIFTPFVGGIAAEKAILANWLVVFNRLPQLVEIQVANNQAAATSLGGRECSK